MPDAIGIVAFTPQSIYIKGLRKYRPVAAYSYVGRYRLVDIPISNMANSGIEHIQVYTNGNPKVLFDHIGSARHYNINNKHGHISIIPVFDEVNAPETISDVYMYHQNLPEIEKISADYVIIAPVNFVYKSNYADLINQHINSGADVSVLYTHVESNKGPVTEDAKERDPLSEYLNADFLTFGSKKQVKCITQYVGGLKSMDMSLSTYIMSKKVFKQIVEDIFKYSSNIWLNQGLNMLIEDKGLNVNGINYVYPVFPILSLVSYFHSNLNMLNEKNMSFFNDPNWPIYTRTNDSPPTIYFGKGSSKSALISNGCVIEGEVMESILGRGVKVGKNAQVYRSILLPGAEVRDGAMVSNCIIDKDAVINPGVELYGYDFKPTYVKRGGRK